MAATPLFFDHNSSTPVSPRVEKRMLEVLHEFYGNPHSQTHRHGWNAANLISELSLNISSHFSDNFQTVFTSGATEANNLAFNLKGSSKRTNVLIGPLEHSAVTEPAARLAQKLGGKLINVPCDKEGYVDHKFITDEILEGCVIASVAFASGETGTVQTKLEDIRAKIQSKGVMFHSDMSQALQHVQAREFAAKCDAISISGHKIYGPQGTGAFLATDDYLEIIEPIFIGGGQQDGLRAGTMPTFLCAGLAEALSETFEWTDSGGHSELTKKVSFFFQRLEAEFESLKLDSLEIIGPRTFSERTPGNLTIALPKKIDASDLLLASANLFSASQGSACHSGQETASPSLRALGLSDLDARRVIRFGIGRDTTEADITSVVAGLAANI